MIGYLLRYDAEGNETEITVELEGYISKYYPAVMYLKNGDPGYPEEGGELEDFSVWLGDEDITETLTKAEYEDLVEQFHEKWEEPGLW